VSETLTVALIGAGVGALAGIGGSVVGALASLRASQLAARIPLAEKIHQLSQAVVKLTVATGKPDYSDRMADFQIAWNDLIVHEKILAPSRHLHLLAELVRDAAIDRSLAPGVFPTLAGEALNASTDIIAAYSGHMFRWRAWLEARQIAKRFKNRMRPLLKSEGLLRICGEL
jgi:hypothetical protein